jgi:DNA-binding LacI/PurR family transcriptional regulator
LIPEEINEAKKLISIKQIAQLCGVSIPTVSKALHGNYKIKDGTRKRIMSIAQQYNYRPNALVRSLRSSRTLTVGVACNSFSDEYAGTILAGIMKCLHSNQYEALVINWDMSVRDGSCVLQSMGERRVDGILMFPPEKVPPPTYLTELRAFHGPVVVIDQKWPGCEYDFVGNADQKGAFDVTEYLIKLGHRKIGNIHAGSLSTGQSRLEGFRDAMSVHGLPMDQKWIAEIRYSISSEEAYSQALKLLSMEDRPTAVVCFNDYSAMGVLGAAFDLGIKVPEELSITGFADLMIARSFRPKLTTVRQKAVEIGYQATELLLKRIESKSENDEGNLPAEAVTLLLPAELVIRESTAPPGGLAGDTEKKG